MFNFRKSLATLSGKTVVLLGDPVVDAYIFGETVRVSREAPVLVVRKERSEYRLGGVANTAANVAALGARAIFLGYVPSDPAGDQLLTMLKAAGVETTQVVRGAGVSAVKTRILAGAYGTGKQQVLRLDEEPPHDGGSVADKALATRLQEVGTEADAIIISEYGLGYAGDAVANAARALAKAARVVCVDSRYALERFAGVTVVTPNIPEAEAIVKATLNSKEAVERAGPELLRRLDVEAVLLTKGRHGMSLFRRHAAPQHIDIVGSDEVTDVTGAGDTVIATFACGLGAGLGMEESMRLANCAAAVVVGKMGTATATPAEILAIAHEQDPHP